MTDAVKKILEEARAVENPDKNLLLLMDTVEKLGDKAKASNSYVKELKEYLVKLVENSVFNKAEEELKVLEKKESELKESGELEAKEKQIEALKAEIKTLKKAAEEADRANSGLSEENKKLESLLSTILQHRQSEARNEILVLEDKIAKLKQSIQDNEAKEKLLKKKREVVKTVEEKIATVDNKSMVAIKGGVRYIDGKWAHKNDNYKILYNTMEECIEAQLKG